MKSLNLNRNTVKGFSLVELLLVLGVLAILLVAAFVVYPQVRDRNQANAEVTNLTTIKANISNLYASTGNYASLTPLVAFNARVFPTNMNASASGATSSWGGTVTVAVDGTNSRLFNITYTNVPAGVCLGLVSGAAGNFEQIEVGGDPVIGALAGDPPAFTEALASQGGQFSPADAASACAGAPVTVILTSN